MAELRQGPVDDASDPRAVVHPAARQGDAPATSRSEVGESAGAAAPSCMTVLYDGACPLCRREIALYRDLPATAPLRFADVSDPQTALPEGVARDRLLARFHVRRADGRLLDGAPAFLAMWAVLPGWRWLARAGRLPGVAWLLEQAYRGFLHLRPALQRSAARLNGRPRTDGHAGS